MNYQVGCKQSVRNVYIHNLFWVIYTIFLRQYQIKTEIFIVFPIKIIRISLVSRSVRWFYYSRKRIRRNPPVSNVYSKKIRPISSESTTKRCCTQALHEAISIWGKIFRRVEFSENISKMKVPLAILVLFGCSVGVFGLPGEFLIRFN